MLTTAKTTIMVVVVVVAVMMVDTKMIETKLIEDAVENHDYRLSQLFIDVF